MDVSMEMDTDTDGTGNCTKCSDFDKLVDLLIEKCKVSSRKEKIQLLTLVPDSWSKQKTQKIFGVSEYLVRRARLLKKEKGILSDPDRKLGQLKSR